MSSALAPRLTLSAAFSPLKSLWKTSLVVSYLMKNSARVFSRWASSSLYLSFILEKAGFLMRSRSSRHLRSPVSTWLCWWVMRSMSRVTARLLRPSLRIWRERRPRAWRISRSSLRRLGRVLVPASTWTFSSSRSCSAWSKTSSFSNWWCTCWVAEVLSASSSSSTSSDRPTTSRILPGFSFSILPMSMSRLAARREREMARMTLRTPTSMRLAISTSSSRLRRGTVPISLRYMRTGSLNLSLSGLSISTSESLSPLGIPSVRTNSGSMASRAAWASSSVAPIPTPSRENRLRSSSRSAGLEAVLGRKSLSWSTSRKPFFLPMEIRALVRG